MKFAFYTSTVSPHQLPFARRMIASLGEGEYSYIYTIPFTEERREMGWVDEKYPWIIPEWEYQEEARSILEYVDVLMSGNRDLALFERRANKGLRTIYCSERWFKPDKGILRLLSPSFWKMARRFVWLLRSSDKVLYYPMGIHAARDMARLCGLMHGDLRCLFRAPKLDFVKRPGGEIWLAGNVATDSRRYCLDKMRMWGYFVEPSKFEVPNGKAIDKINNTVRVLWVGRLLGLKHVDTIIRAVGEYANLRHLDESLPTITLDVYGIGPEESRLKKMALKWGDVVRFYLPVSIDMVRKLMREHDIYVLASDAHEGWGAVVSEALAEGMRVFATCESGSGATMLSDECLFRAGDWRRLACLLRSAASELPQAQGIGAWSVEEGVKRMLAAIKS